MKNLRPLVRFLLGSMALSLAALTARSAPPIPHLEKQGTAMRLIVDGKPFLILGGELSNTGSSSLEYMKPVWPRMTKLNLNTVLVAVAWDWIEPEEGKYDFTLVDGLLAGARANNQRVVFLWFGSWKNGISSFVPAWVKANQERFPRVQLKTGKSIEILSTLSETNRDADARAYAAFMRHVREVDAEKRTVIMIQMENEVGAFGDSRDRSAAADAAFAKPVPAELMSYLVQHKDGLMPEFRAVWEKAGFKTAGNWEEVFGVGPATDEIFMAWNYARYMNRITAAGKAEYPLPVYTNTWIVQPEDKGSGDYPSGGPEPHVLDIWRAGAPAID
ncbi:MAG: beta-galactosidase, partial [Verrucomicrobiota bacterium]